MERYGQFYGTNNTGHYVELGTSQGMTAFLQRNGAQNPGAVCAEIAKPLSHFKQFEDYDKATSDDYPVSVCYVPMHLDRTNESFRGMKPLYAIAVNGNENRERDTSYSCFAVMSQEEILAGTYTHLDHIFGTPLVSWMELCELREQNIKKDYSMTPSRVEIPIREKDRSVVVFGVKTIYSGACLVIRVEKGFGFNRRAMELLSQIYSLLPPRLAVETGFVTYQTESAAQAIQERTGVRVYVIPAEAEFPKLKGDVVRLDMNEPAIILEEKDDVVKAAKWWSKQEYSQRIEAMRTIFGDPRLSLMDAEEYGKRTRSLSEEVKKLKNPGEMRISDPEGLKRWYNSFSESARSIEWIRKRIRANAQKLLAQGLTLEQLEAEAAARLVMIGQQENPDPAERKDWQSRFSAAHVLVSGDATKEGRNRSFQAFAKGSGYVVEQTTGVLQAQLRQADALRQTQLDEQRTAFTQELEKQKLDHAQRLKLQDESHTQELNKERAEHSMALTTMRQQLSAEQAARQQDQSNYNDQLQQLNRQAKERIRQYQDNELRLRQERDQARLQIDSLNRDLAETQRACDAKLRQTQLECDQAVIRASEERDQAVQKANAERDLAEKKLRQGREDGSVASGKSWVALVLSALAGLVVGCLIIGLIWFGTSRVANKPEETTPSVLPVTQTPTEPSTEPSTTPPTTPPPTEPPTTEPPTTEPREPFTADGQINWDVVLEDSGLFAVENGHREMKELLEAYLPEDEGEVVALVTTDRDGFEMNLLPERFAVLIQLKEQESQLHVPQITSGKYRSEGQMEDFGSRNETDPSQTQGYDEDEDNFDHENAVALTENASLVVQGEYYRLIIIGDDELQTACLKLFQLINPAEDGSVSLSVRYVRQDDQDGQDGQDDQVDAALLELGTLISDVLEETDWWLDVTKVSVQESDVTEGRERLNSNRTPIVALHVGKQAVYIYDYTDDSDKASEMCGIQKKNGREAAEIDGLVAVAYSGK